MRIKLFWIIILLSTMIVAGCSVNRAKSGPTAAPESFTDPMAYCAAVGTIDQPDARYTGEPVPDIVVQTLMKAFGTPADVSREIYADPQRSFWRCMDHEVYACNVGANLPCMSKAKTDRTPTAALETYCRQNPNVDFVPMVVTGHDTIYAWKCQGSSPVISEQIAQTDAQGFLANIWYKVSLSDSSSSDPPPATAVSNQTVTPTVRPTLSTTRTATRVPTPSFTLTPTSSPATVATTSPTSTSTPVATPATTPEQTPTEAVVLIIIDGARWSETFGDPDHQYIPHLANYLAPLGAINNAFYNDGLTLTVPGHAAIVTGTWQDIPNNGQVRPSAPTIFEYYRAALEAPPSEAVFVHGSFIEPVLTYSTHPDYGPDFGAQMLFSDEPTVPYDDGMWANARQVITEQHPHLLMISLLDPDEAAHAGQWENYLQAIRHDDEIIWDLWQHLQADPFYAGRTTLIVTNDHGRGCGDGWRDHGGNDECNRHVMFLAVGPAIQPGLIIDRHRSLRDITPTIGHLLGVNTPFAVGEVMTELFAQK